MKYYMSIIIGYNGIVIDSKEASYNHLPQKQLQKQNAILSREGLCVVQCL